LSLWTMLPLKILQSLSFSQPDSQKDLDSCPSAGR
jgi:hypothetical protein